MRRHLVLEKAEFPKEVADGLQAAWSANGNPWNLAAADRAATGPKGLDRPTMAEGRRARRRGPLLGRLRRLVRRRAASASRSRSSRSCTRPGVTFAILGSEETCTGDAARRLGNEYLFQTLAQQNVETLNGYRVKKIVTNCPHCFNTLANEYPDFGGKYEVVHGTAARRASSSRAGRIDADDADPEQRSRSTTRATSAATTASTTRRATS